MNELNGFWETPQKHNSLSSSCTMSRHCLRTLEVYLSSVPGQDTSPFSVNVNLRLSELCHADHGVLAYARKPVHRERPNERFLLGTIRSVAFGEVAHFPCILGR